MNIDDLTAEDMREDASEKGKRLAAEFLAGKVVWCGQCDEWALPEAPCRRADVHHEFTWALGNPGPEHE
jgi:hypothetical protein